MENRHEDMASQDLFLLLDAPGSWEVENERDGRTGRGHLSKRTVPVQGPRNLQTFQQSSFKRRRLLGRPPFS